MITLPPGATDASLTPYHIDRGKLFIRERFGGHHLIDAEVIAANIERTRFPVPDDSDHQGTADYPGLGPSGRFDWPACRSSPFAQIPCAVLRICRDWHT